MKKGSLLMCIENDAAELEEKAAIYGLQLPQIGGIYTHDGIDEYPYSDHKCIFLCELKQYTIRGEEISYRAHWFTEILPPMDIAEELFSFQQERGEL